jgi:hypothetical protein
MEIESKADLKLVGRAIRNGWNVDKEEVKRMLSEVASLRDPELLIEAAKLFLVADGLDVKRDELELKREAKENEQRLRLLELARSAPATELARIASSNGIVVDARSTD